jgi:hypothetical protein
MIGDMLAAALLTVEAAVSDRPFQCVVVKPVMTTTLVLPLPRPDRWPLLVVVADLDRDSEQGVATGPEAFPEVVRQFAHHPATVRLLASVELPAREWRAVGMHLGWGKDVLVVLTEPAQNDEWARFLPEPYMRVDAIDAPSGTALHRPDGQSHETKIAQEKAAGPLPRPQSVSRTTGRLR